MGYLLLFLILISVFKPIKMLAPLLLFATLLIPPVLQAIYSSKRVKGKSRLPLALLAFITLPLGLAFSIVVIIVYEWLWPSNLKCDMSIVAFPIMELMLLIVSTPTIYLAYRLNTIQNTWHKVTRKS